MWLFSRETLSLIPDAYDEVDLVTLDRFLPERPGQAANRRHPTVRVAGARPDPAAVLPPAGALNWLLKPLVASRASSTRRAGRPDGPQVPGLVRLVVLAIAIRWILASLDLPLLERQFWTTTAGLLLIVALGWFLLLLNEFGEGYLRRRFANGGETHLAPAAGAARRGRAGDFVLQFPCLRYFGFDPTAALAGLGIGGIAIALAAQKTLENVIAGLSLIFDKAVRVGDSLKFGDTVGTVDYIGLRSTRIRTLDRTILSVPNGQIASVGIETLSERDKFWFHPVSVFVTGRPSDQMRAVIDGVRALLLTNADVDSDSVRVRFFRLGSFSLDIEVFAYVFAGDWESLSHDPAGPAAPDHGRSTSRGRPSRFPRRRCTSPAGFSGRSRGGRKARVRRPTLSSRMAVVLTALRRLQRSPDAGAVHDLRVAVRRCRSVGALMKEVDPHPAWRRMTHQVRGLFRALGELRDLQVLEESIERLTHADDPLRGILIGASRPREAEARERVTLTVEAFDRKAWRRLARVLHPRGHLVTPEGAAA